MLASALACTAQPARAADPELRHIRICDTSACYYAWNVVDSDRDGVCDADEIAVGSDPYDPNSKPPLSVVVALLGKGLLPTYEFGVGKVIVYPDKLQSTIEAGLKDPLAAFPMGKRADAMSLIGLPTELMAEHGFDVEHDGITLTLQHDQKSGLPEARMGGVVISLISADDGEDPVLNDVTEIYNYDDGSTGYLLDNGDFLYDGADGHGLRQDKDGNIIDDWYVNPDADTGTGEPTPEQFAAWKRVQNATKRTVVNREPIGGEDPSTIVDRGDHIILIDPEYSDYVGIESGPPQIDRAEPELHPGLPNPLEAACTKCP
ncbi:hypothetical protein [Lysobacter sp. CFH 32150]|uniref:hypothetical protein n=1 Tax=Lysobacter sp. CFH 32150 TaxID=2927128 RepID=UPI001FA81645|nr:hypothetical protein [Lysobacter sp. CFH 32150]MCI4568514.1 hypothetical protein [Lysobacter sp. CFH 32150]